MTFSESWCNFLQVFSRLKNSWTFRRVSLSFFRDYLFFFKFLCFSAEITIKSWVGKPFLLRTASMYPRAWLGLSPFIPNSSISSKVEGVQYGSWQITFHFQKKNREFLPHQWSANDWNVAGHWPDPKCSSWAARKRRRTRPQAAGSPPRTDPSLRWCLPRGPVKFSFYK